jgi:hypothetical protein
VVRSCVLVKAGTAPPFGDMFAGEDLADAANFPT